MTRDDIIRMAREAGFETGAALCEVVVRHSNGSWVGINAELIEFAALVAAAEREACAKAIENSIGQIPDTSDWANGYIQAAKDIAEGIRARGGPCQDQ